MKIKFFGTWAATPTNCDNTHFMIEDNWQNLFVDAWWWRDLQKRISKKEVPMPQNIFLTHCHTDHFLWLPHVLRVIKSPVKLYLSKDLFEKLEKLNEIVGIKKKFTKLIEDKLLSFEIIEEWKEVLVNDWSLLPINLYSKKVEQFWFSLNINWKIIIFFGDEAIEIMKRNDLDLYKNPEVLICETFCLENQKQKLKPHEKSHITAKETWEIAKVINPKKVFVIHYTEIQWQDRREQAKEIYEEVKTFCNCEVIVPIDEESFDL